MLIKASQKNYFNVHKISWLCMQWTPYTCTENKKNSLPSVDISDVMQLNFWCLKLLLDYKKFYNETTWPLKFFCKVVLS